jgi:glutamyl-tRNA synthetase
MAITHITRGEEWIPSTPAHIQVFEAFGWELPAFVHTPLLLNADRSKISKRKHPWSKISWFVDEGYLPSAVMNYLGGLAVHVPDPDNPVPGIDRDLFGFPQIVENVDLHAIGPSGKIVDLNRLDWLNGQYIRRLSIGELMDHVRRFMEDAGLHVAGDPKLAQALALEQERMKRLSEAPKVLAFFFRDEPYDPRLLIPKGLDRERTQEVLREASRIVKSVRDQRWSAAALEAAFRQYADRAGIKMAQIAGGGGVRVAVTCRTAGPPLFETMEVLGPDTVMRRLAEASGKLAALDI